MKVNDDLLTIELPMSFGGETRALNLALILDEVHGPTLVDTGLPAQEHLVLEQLNAAGFQPHDLKRILITHQDSDHIGSMAALKELTGAEILALDAEAPFIEGTVPPYKMPPPETLDRMPEVKKMIESLKRCKVDTLLQDGQELDLAGGVWVVATPGHTKGHLSLYLKRTKTLITGDAMVSDNGTLEGPMEMATPDMVSARESVRKLSALDVDKILCYHGGVVDKDANGQLQKLASQ